MIVFNATNCRDTSNPGRTLPAFRYAALDGSSSRISYTISGRRANQTVLRLPDWTCGQSIYAMDSSHSYNSTTETFTCSAGDTLSFYRELEWQNPMTSLQDTNNNVALDSLDFTVELVRTPDSARIALIDSIGILPNAQPDRPRIHGMRPLMALVKYIVPPELNGARAFMRMLLYHRGTGNFWFTRYDEIKPGEPMHQPDSK